MKDFWNDRAAENALYYVDSRLHYPSPDETRFWEQGESDLNQLIDLIGRQINGQDHVVEIGCGVGRLTRGIAGQAERVTAIDVSSRMLELAHQHNPELTNVEWVEGDGESLRMLGDASATVCISHVVFQHIPDPRITLNYVMEMGRVLKPGGWAGFQISNLPELHEPRSMAQRFKDLPTRLRRGAPRGQNHEAWRGSAIDLEDLRITAERSGLHVSQTSGEGTQWCVVRLDREQSHDPMQT